MNVTPAILKTATSPPFTPGSTPLPRPPIRFCIRNHRTEHTQNNKVDSQVHRQHNELCASEAFFSCSEDYFADTRWTVRDAIVSHRCAGLEYAAESRQHLTASCILEARLSARLYRSQPCPAASDNERLFDVENRPRPAGQTDLIAASTITYRGRTTAGHRTLSRLRLAARLRFEHNPSTGEQAHWGYLLRRRCLLLKPRNCGLSKATSPSRAAPTVFLWARPSALTCREAPGWRPLGGQYWGLSAFPAGTTLPYILRAVLLRWSRLISAHVPVAWGRCRATPRLPVWPVVSYFLNKFYLNTTTRSRLGGAVPGVFAFEYGHLGRLMWQRRLAPA